MAARARRLPQAKRPAAAVSSSTAPTAPKRPRVAIHALAPVHGEHGEQPAEHPGSFAFTTSFSTTPASFPGAAPFTAPFAAPSTSPPFLPLPVSTTPITTSLNPVPLRVPLQPQVLLPMPPAGGSMHQLSANPSAFGNGSASQPPGSGIAQSQEHLNAVTHATRLEMVQQQQETTKTGATYGRHVDNYTKYWSALQDAYCERYPTWTRVPAFPITAMKAALFVRYEMERPKLVKSNKTNQSGTVEYQQGTTVGVQSIKQTINALEAYRRNHAWEYPLDHETRIKLRDDLRIRTIEDDAAKNESQRVDKAQKLKAAGTSADTYTKDDLILLSRNALCEPTTATQLVVNVRDRAMLLLAAQTAFRGDNLRQIQLSDLFMTTVPNPHAGPECYFEVMGILADQGKTNQHSRVDEFGSLRHKRPELCAVGALALYLFVLYHPELGKQAVPSFAPEFSPDAQAEGYGTFGKREWYGLYVFRPEGKTCSEAMTYNNHYRRVKKMHDNAGISISKATHAGRTKAAQTAREYGASVNDTKALGLWNESGSYRNCYDRLFPIGAMLGAANHLATQPEAFCVARAALEVPEDLLALVFPWVEREEAALLERSSADPANKDIALVQLLRMLKWMRTVLIQDLAVLYSMQPRWPSHVFNFKPFNLPIFDSFARGVATRLADIEQTARLRLDQFPERIAGGFRSAILDFALQQRTEQAANRQLLDDLHQQIAALAAVIRNVQRPPPTQPVRLTQPVQLPPGNTHTSYNALLRAQQANLVPEGGHWPNARLVSERAHVPEHYTPPLPSPDADSFPAHGALSPSPSLFPSLTSHENSSVFADFAHPLPSSPASTHAYDAHAHGNVNHNHGHAHAHAHASALEPAPVHAYAPAGEAPHPPAPAPAHAPAHGSAAMDTFGVHFASHSLALPLPRTTTLPIPGYAPTGNTDPAALTQNWRDICIRYAAHLSQIEAHRAAGDWQPSKDGRRWIPGYKFSSSTGLFELWKEWTEGCDGKLSVEALDTGWGSTWRTPQAIRTAHCRRARVIGFLRKLMDQQRWGIHLALQFLDTKGAAYRKHTSLYTALVVSGTEARLLEEARVHKFR